jgi:prolyl-tRNA editing enzyme YbaK/EbsC (Cys-tRNA(Pro) deacylase)
MDPDLDRFPVVWAAAGSARANFPVPPGTLAMLTDATVAPIAEDQADSADPADVALRGPGA